MVHLAVAVAFGLLLLLGRVRIEWGMSNRFAGLDMGRYTDLKIPHHSVYCHCAIGSSEHFSCPQHPPFALVHLLLIVCQRPE